MSLKKPFYITTPIFYPNSKLHIGNAYAASICDIFARMARVIGRPAYFLTGADENSLKVQDAAKKAGMDVMDYLDTQVTAAKDLFDDLHISYNQYIRTTDANAHHPGVIEMWNRLQKAGDIYEGQYEGYYCVGCESFKTEKDLVDGKCPIHETVAEKIQEKNYFFKLSKYQSQIREAIVSETMKVVPESRKNEILAVLDEGLEDISFSRPYQGQANAILVPGDETQAIYVWGDALTNYISALGFGTANTSLFDEFWPEAVHLVGKDILRFHAAIWPGMLLSAGVSLPKEIIVTGLMQSGGKKMSKTLGNVIDPLEMIELVGSEGLRFYFAHDVPLLDDGEVTKDLIVTSYNAHLANGIGNLCNRLLKMMISYDVMFDQLSLPQSDRWESVQSDVSDFLDARDISGYSLYIWKIFSSLDEHIQVSEPFKLYKTDPESAQKIVKEMIELFYIATYFASPILPHTVPKIIQHLETRMMPEAPLFAKLMDY